MRTPLPVVLAVLALSPLARADSLVEITQSVGLGQPAGSPASHQLIAGLVAGDVDGDGRPDLLSIGGGLLQFRRGLVGGFAPPTELAGLDRQRTYEGLTLADLDGDGDLDLLVFGRGRSHLFLFADGRYTDVTATHLPPLGGHAMTGLPADLDGDGDLDLIVSRYVDIANFPFHRCAPSAVLSNEGGARFVDRSAASGIGAGAGCTFVSVAHDIDADGIVEILEINDFSQTVAGHSVWVQRGRDADGWPMFVDEAEVLGFEAPTYGMGVAIGDPDGDGDEEYVVTNIGQVAALSFDRQAGRFVPFEAPPVRFSAEDLVATWAGTFVDLDGDGAPELVLSGSTLGASAMVVNADPPESPVLSWRAGAWSPWGAGRSFGPARDAVSVDLTGDAIAELLTIERSGFVRAWRRPTPTVAPFVIALRPTLTGSAWGARAVLRCAEGERAVSATGGAHYGQTAVATLELPAPPECVGDHAEVEILWPSGWRDTARVERGVVTALTEPEWQRVEEGALVVSAEHLSHLGLTPADLSADAGGLQLFEPEVTAAGDLRVPFASVPSDAASPHAADPWIGLRLNGAPPRSIRRVPRRTAASAEVPRLWLGGAPLVTGVPVNGWVGADVDVLLETPEGLEALPTVPGFGGRAFVHTPRATDIALRAGAARFDVTPAPDHDPSSALLMASDHVFTPALAASRPARVRLRLLDAAGRAAAIAPARIELVWRGSGVSLGHPEASGGGWFTWELPRAELSATGELIARVDGQAAPGSVRPVRLSTASDLGGLVSPSRSRCTLSEPWLDGVEGDLGTLVTTFRDADGHELPLLGLAPAWVQGGGIAPIVGGGTASIGFLQTPVVTASASSGPSAPSVRVGDMTAPVPCRASVRASAAQSFAPERSTVRAASADSLRVDEVAGFIAVPRSSAGRAIGAGVSLEVRSCGGPDSPTADLAIPPLYAGGGRYTFAVVPRGAGRLCVGVGLAGSEGGTARTHVVVHEPPTEPGPEPGPEPDSDEPRSDEDVEQPDDGPETGPEADGNGGLDPAEPADASGQSSEVATPDLSGEPAEGVGAADPTPRTDDGCGGAPGPAPLGLLIAALLRVRQRCRAPSIRV